MVGDLIELLRAGRLARRPVKSRWSRTRQGLLEHVARAIGTRALADFSAADLWLLQHYGLSVGLAASTVNKITHNVLRGLLSAAVAHGLMPPAVVARAYAGGRKLREAAPADRLPWTRAERDTLLEAMRRDPYAAHYVAYVAFLFYTGMRPGEALGLTWGCVDLRRRWCRIFRGRSEGEKAPTTLKTAGSVREIRLARSAVAVLAGLRRRADDELIFLGPRGAPIRQGNFSQRIWKRVLQRVAGRVPPRVVYCARHTFSSHAIEHTGDIAQTAAYTGNSPETARKRYYRWTKGLDVDLDEALAPRSLGRLHPRGLQN